MLDTSTYKKNPGHYLSVAVNSDLCINITEILNDKKYLRSKIRYILFINIRNLKKSKLFFFVCGGVLGFENIQNSTWITWNIYIIWLLYYVWKTIKSVPREISTTKAYIHSIGKTLLVKNEQV